MTQTTRNGGKILADALAAHGVKMAFGVPGESYLPVLDGLYDHREQIRFITTRQEGGAAYMAEAYGKLTGQPGVLMVTRGPGACNATVGLHTAFQDSTPLVALIGQVGSDCIEREAFQEIDYRRMYGQITKWVAQIDRVDRIPEFISRAFHTAMSGRKGPVALALPEDIMFGTAAVPDLPAYQVVQASASASQLARVRDMLAKASRPFVVVGGSGFGAATRDQLRQWAEACDLPVGTAFRNQDRFDNDSPSYVGDVSIGSNPKMSQRIREADVLLVIGARLGEMTTSAYTVMEAPNPRQRLIHVHAGAEELGRVFSTELPINAGAAEFIAALSDFTVDGAAWRDRTRDMRGEYLAWRQPTRLPGQLQYGDVVEHMDKALATDAIVCIGAGNYSAWVQRQLRFGKRRILAPTNGSMGYGLPAAVAAKIAEPRRQVVCVTGDGDFLMNGQEFATAVQYKAPIIAVLVNNGMYGTIRMHQEREYPGRTIATDLVNPDFAAYARAFGGHGERVETTDAFAPAFERAVASGKPALIELAIDPQAITPSTTLDAIRQSALSKQAAAA